jgi:hypothetical protein
VVSQMAVETRLCRAPRSNENAIGGPSGSGQRLIAVPLTKVMSSCGIYGWLIAILAMKCASEQLSQMEAFVEYA